MSALRRNISCGYDRTVKINFRRTCVYVCVYVCGAIHQVQVFIKTDLERLHVVNVQVHTVQTVFT